VLCNAKKRKEYDNDNPTAGGKVRRTGSLSGVTGACVRRLYMSCVCVCVCERRYTHTRKC